jgi:hypothetical protein
MKLFRLIFVLAVVSFNTPNFPGLFGHIGFYARYGFLVVLIPASLVAVSRKQVRVPPGVLATYYLFVTYAFVTTLWTENVALSVVKWIIYVPLCITLLFAGMAMRDEKEQNPFWPMKYVFVPIVLISIVALARGIGWFNGNFRGFCGNSNALGATLMLTSPWVLLELRNHWNRSRYRLLLLGLCGATAVIMVLCASRAAMGGTFFILCAAGWGLKLGRKFVIGYALVVMLMTVYMVRPSTYSFVYESYVEKHSTDVLHSRSEQLQDTWDAAKKGGVFGAGFGVSIGESRYWNMQSFSDFSREKGNSMLAVVEELGVVGFAFYLALLYAVWGSMRQLSRTADPEGKFLYKLSLGFLFGALFHSAFEAWFISSGPDIAVFWATIGLVLGALTLHSRNPNERFARMEAPVRSRLFPGPAIPRP